MTASWFGAFADLPREHGFEPLRIDGTIPAELDGRLVRCGPARASCFGHRYRHWFDGDGAVMAVRFRGGTAEGAVRYVETPGLVAERSAGKALFPSYGTLAPGPHRPFPRPKNAANTSVMSWQHRLFALHETGLPVEISRDLATLGERDLGVLGECFSAHPKLVGDRIFNFATHYGPKTRIEMYELGATARTLGSFELDGPAMVHDFAATEHHLIFFVPPLRLRATDLAAGYCYSDALDWRPQLGTEVIVVPLDAADEPIRFTADPFHQWHFANAFERGGEIVVDFVRYPDFGSNRWFASMTTGRPWPDVRQGSLARATIRTGGGSAARRAMHVEARSDVLLEFPQVSPRVATRAHEVIYAVAHTAHADAHDRIVRIDATGEVIDAALAPGQFPDEPVFVPRAGGTAEDDGWLLSLVYDARAHASHVAIFDARRLDAGPLARAWYDHHIPFTFHGLWIQDM